MVGRAVLIWLCFATVYCAKKSYEPSVAFVCGRGAMHMKSEDSWISDPSSDCIEDKEEILKYCKKVYPNLFVTNIVESSSYQHITGWCSLGKKCIDSQEAFKVRAYRCLTGPFQSDALIVPKTCQFDHISQTGLCKDFDYWKAIAEKTCGLQKLRTESYAMLRPCGTDVFTGVEYVCCPNDQPSTSEKNETHLEVEAPSISVKVSKSPTAADDDKTNKDSTPMEKYVHMRPELYRNTEHDVFKLAKKDLVKENDSKLAKLMKQWSDAKHRVEEMKKVDPKAAEAMSKEITPRFQKEYFALQVTADSKLVELDSVHQQHVQSNLNGKKRKAAEKLMQALQAITHKSAVIKKYLERYIAVEQKDAHHCVKHYLKIRSHDPAVADSMLPATVEHLSLISTRINESFGLLDTLNDEVMQEDISSQVREWLRKHYTSIDGTIRKLKETAPKQAATAAESGAEKSAEKEKKVDPVVLVKPPTIKIEVVHAGKTDADKMDLSKPDSRNEDSADMYKKYADKLEKTDFVKKQTSQSIILPADLNEHEETIKVSQAVLPEMKMSHLAKGDSLSADSKPIGVKRPSAPSAVGPSAGTVLAIIAGLLVSLLVVVGVIVGLRRTGGRKPAPNTYLEVAADEGLSPEDRHIASMQSGYENPTYKFLEQRSV